MIVLTHCYPTKDNPTSGIWLHRVFDSMEAIDEVWHISKFAFLNPLHYLAMLSLTWVCGYGIIACWIVPSGFIACLSAKSYILYCLGRDCFWIERHKWFAWLCEPIFRRAKTVVFHSERVRQAINSAYGGKYDGQIIHTPVSAKEFYPKDTES